MGIRSELDYFTKLGHPNDSIRYKSGRKILSMLRRDQNVEKLIYTLKRLITGLGGTKLRAGCFATLTSLLQFMPEHLINFETFDEIIKICLSPRKGDTKKEIGDAFLGELLAYAAIINTNFLKSESDDIRQIISSRLMKIAQSKSYLHHPALIYLAKLACKYEVTYVSDTFRNHLMRLEEHTLDKLYYILCLNSTKESDIVKIVFKTDNSDVMNNDVLMEIAKLLLKCCTLSTVDHPFFELFAQQSFQVGKLSFFWKTLTSQIDSQKQKKSRIILYLMDRIIDVVKEAEFLVSDILNVPALRILYKEGKKDPIVKDILIKVINLTKEANSSTKLRLITTILFDADCLYFDVKTGVRIVDQLIGSLEFSEIKTLSKKFVSTLDGSLMKSTNESWTEKEKTKLFNYYTKLLLLKVSHDKKKWRCRQLQLVVDMGLFTTPTFKINMQLSGIIKDFLFNAIGQVHSNIFTHREILADLVGYINMKITNGCELRTKLKPEIYEMWKERVIWSFNIYEESIPPEKEDLCGILQVLAFHVLISIFGNPKYSLDEFKDIMGMYQSAMSQNNKHGTTLDEDWSDNLIDLLMRLLSIPSSGNRVLVNLLFKNAVKCLKSDAFGKLINVLDLEENEIDHSVDKDNDSDSEGNSNQDTDEEPDHDSDNDTISGNGLKEHNVTGQETAIIQNSTTLPTFTNDDDNSSIDLDDADVTEVNRLDQLLGEVMKNQRLKTKKKKLTLSEVTLYRIRILDLIEICCKETSYIPFTFWMDLLPVLIKLFKHTTRRGTDLPLYSKIGSCMKKISTVQIYKNDENVLIEHSSGVMSILQELMDVVEKGYSAHYRNTLLALTKPLIKISNVYQLHTTENANDITELMTRHFEKFFLLRSKIPVTYFLSLCEIKWKGMNSLINMASKFIFDRSIKLNRRILGVRIIGRFFSNDLNFNEEIPQDVINCFETQFCNFKGHSDLCGNPQLYQKFIKELNILLKLLQKKDRHKLFTNWYTLLKRCDKITAKLSKDFPNSKPSVSLQASYNAEESAELHSSPEEVVTEQATASNKRKKNSKVIRKQSKKRRLEACNLDEWSQNFNELVSSS